MLKEMATVATECIKHPQTRSIWSPEIGKYVCSKYNGAEPITRQGGSYSEPATINRKLPNIGDQFKMIFLTAAIGTLLFIIICVGVTLAIGKEPPPLTEKIIISLFDLAKIGFGAIVGLLGGFVSRAKEEQSKAAGTGR